MLVVCSLPPFIAIEAHHHQPKLFLCLSSSSLPAQAAVAFHKTPRSTNKCIIAFMLSSIWIRRKLSKAIGNDLMSTRTSTSLCVVRTRVQYEEAGGVCLCVRISD